MALHIREPVVVPAAGDPPKLIRELVGRASTGDRTFSVARMSSPPGWSEPPQQPSFDEVTVVLDGAVLVETDEGSVAVRAGEAFLARAGERVRYSTPEGAEYLAVCVPAFSLETVHRESPQPPPTIA